MHELSLYSTRLKGRPFNPGKLPRPLTPAYNLSLPAGPLDIEIGCGVGLHPVRYALANSDRHLVAIEHTGEKFSKFAGRVTHHGSPANLTPVHANAISWITHMIELQRVERYFLLYPNPHPKPGDRKQRWYGMPFMGHLLATLAPGGTLTLATNLQFYAREACHLLTECWGLTLQRHDLLHAEQEDFEPRTHFEAKYLARGEICHNLVFSKSFPAPVAGSPLALR